MTYPLPLHATQTISTSWKTAPMEKSKESLCRTAASYDLRVLRLYVEIRTRKIMTTTKMKAPNRSDFSKTSFMIGFRMLFNSKYQPSYRVASDRSLLQGWNTDPFPEVCVAIIYDTENRCSRGANLKFHWITNLLCVWPLLVCHWLKVLGRLLR
jgi:hypothetical protein